MPTSSSEAVNDAAEDGSPPLVEETGVEETEETEEAIPDEEVEGPSNGDGEAASKPGQSQGTLKPYIDLLKRNRNYRILFIANIISELGNWFSLVATWGILQNVWGSTMAIAINSILTVAPPFFFGTFIGLFLDNTDKRRAMIITCFLRGILVLLCIFCQSKEALVALYILIFLRYTVNSVYVPARTAMVPEVVTKEDLLVANGLDGVVWSSMIFFGGALGGIGTALLGVTGSFILDAMAYFVAAYVIALLHSQEIEEPGGGKPRERLDLSEPFREFARFGRRASFWFYSTVLCCLPLRKRLQREDLGRTLRDKFSSNPRVGKSARKLDGSGKSLLGEGSDFPEIEASLETDEKLSWEKSPSVEGDPQNMELRIEMESGDPEERAQMNCTQRLLVYFQVFKYLWATPYILMCTFIKFSIWIPIGVIDIINVRFAQTEFVMGDEGVISVGITYMVIGIGTMITPVIARKFGSTSPRGIQLTIVLGFLQMVIGCLCVAFSPDFVTFLLANLIRSGGTSVTMIYSSLILQQLIPAEFRGRVFSLELLLQTVSECSAQLFAAFVTDYHGWSLRQADTAAAIAASLILPFWAAYFSCSKKHLLQVYKDRM